MGYFFGKPKVEATSKNMALCYSRNLIVDIKTVDCGGGRGWPVGQGRWAAMGSGLEEREGVWSSGRGETKGFPRVPGRLRASTEWGGGNPFNEPGSFLAPSSSRGLSWG